MFIHEELNSTTAYYMCTDLFTYYDKIIVANQLLHSLSLRPNNMNKSTSFNMFKVDGP